MQKVGTRPFPPSPSTCNNLHCRDEDNYLYNNIQESSFCESADKTELEKVHGTEFTVQPRAEYESLNNKEKQDIHEHV